MYRQTFQSTSQGSENTDVKVPHKRVKTKFAYLKITPLFVFAVNWFCEYNYKLSSKNKKTNNKETMQAIAENHFNIIYIL